MEKAKPWIDPSVESVAQLFPKKFLEQMAKDTGLVKRHRKVDIPILFYVLVLGFGVNFLRTVRGMKRRYEVMGDVKLSISSFYNRFTPSMVTFLHNCVLHAIEFQANNTTHRMGERLKAFKDIVIQDSFIIRLHESLADLWPAARSRKVAAGVKVSALVSAVADGMKSVSIVAEKTAEIKTLRIGPWVRDRILLIDLGFFKYGAFDKIQSHGGHFVSRLKSNANPTIIKTARGPKGLEGKKAKDVLPLLKGKALDAVIEVVFRKKVNGKQKNVTVQFRMVAVFNKETEEYHLYITNISADILTAEDTAALYGARWEIEMVFKELKSHYRMDCITSRNPNVIKAMIWISLLTLLCSRRIHQFARSMNPDHAIRYTRLRWATIFTENADELLRQVLKSMDITLTMMMLYNIYLDQPLDPNINRKRPMDGWVE